MASNEFLLERTNLVYFKSSSVQGCFLLTSIRNSEKKINGGRPTQLVKHHEEVG